MGLFTLLYIFAISTSAQAAGNDFSWSVRWTSASQLVSILRQVPGGRKVLKAAEKKDPDFLAKLKFGAASYTESTFSRTYSLLDGKEQIVLRHEITLNQGLAVSDAVVDLAHELVHFTEKGMLDPYQPGFELSQFIRNGIEGEGGELAALAVECQVAWSLETKFEGFPQHSLCEKYRQPDNVFHRDAAMRDYYALGTWFRRSGEELRRVIPELSEKKVVFTSSYAGKPYPLALAEEFTMTQRAACLNNRRKFRLIASQSESGRRPASEELLRERTRLKRYDQAYCRPILDNDARAMNLKVTP
jgi:hypothetical protein